METFISIAGSIASIFGAIWSVREAKKAKRSADAAEQIRKELVGRRSLAEVAQIQSEIRRILGVVARVGPTSTPQLIKGVNCADVAREVESFVAVLLERRNHFTDIYSDRATELRNEIKLAIEGLAEAKSFEDKKRHGKTIYYAIENFAPVVKQLADSQQDRPIGAKS